MMDQSSSAEKPEKSPPLVSDKNRDKMASSDWEFSDALLNVMSSPEPLNLLSALEVLSATALNSACCFHHFLTMDSLAPTSKAAWPFPFSSASAITFHLNSES